MTNASLRATAKLLTCSSLLPVPSRPRSYRTVLLLLTAGCVWAVLAYAALYAGPGGAGLLLESRLRWVLWRNPELKLLQCPNALRPPELTPAAAAAAREEEEETLGPSTPAPTYGQLRDFWGARLSDAAVEERARRCSPEGMFF